jgi:hypothetical protein
MVLPEMHVGRGVRKGLVTMFPVWTAGAATRGLETGRTSRVTASEADGGPAVNMLSVRNDGRHPLLMLEGELLEGGWQSRALVRDMILAPNSAHQVEVSCVEQHRWGGATVHERRARRATPRVQMALRSDDSVRQSKVWDGVNRYGQATSPTPTSSLADHLDRLDGAARIAPMPGQRGVLVGVGDQPLALELFGSAPALAIHLQAIMDATQLDALLMGEFGARVPGRRARRMVERLDRCELDVSLEFAGDGLSLAASARGALVRGVATPTGRLAHVTVLNTRHAVMA